MRCFPFPSHLSFTVYTYFGKIITDWGGSEQNDDKQLSPLKGSEEKQCSSRGEEGCQSSWAATSELGQLCKFKLSEQVVLHARRDLQGGVLIQSVSVQALALIFFFQLWTSFGLLDQRTECLSQSNTAWVHLIYSAMWTVTQ